MPLEERVGRLAYPIELQRGLKIANRIVKAATAEKLAVAPLNQPTPLHLSAYERWGKAGYGLIITGNVQVDPRFLGDAGDVVSTSPDSVAPGGIWSEWAAKSQACGTPTLVQLCHAGRQSALGNGTRGFFEKTIAPSAVPLNFGPGFLATLLRIIMFGTPREMSVTDIKDVIRMFVESARAAEKAGFSGVELHGAHGYLINLFLSPKTNLRSDKYGGSPEKRLTFLKEIIAEVRTAVSESFILGIKLNSADYQQGGLSEEEVYSQVEAIAGYGVDFVEISGGSFEDPRSYHGQQNAGAPDSKKGTNSGSKREAFFVDFAAKVRERVPQIPLMVTGGFRSRQSMRNALDDGACDMVGIARPATLRPEYPMTVLNNKIPDAETVFPTYTVTGGGIKRHLPIKSIGAGLSSLWHSLQIRRFAKGQDTDMAMTISELQN